MTKPKDEVSPLAPFPSDDELELVVIAIQALLPHEPNPKFHDFHAIDRGREILRNCLNRWALFVALTGHGVKGDYDD
jgi:hypothetical protein